MRWLTILFVLVAASLSYSQVFSQCQQNSANGPASSLIVTISTTAGHGLIAAIGEQSDATTTWTVADSAGNTWTQTPAAYSTESSSSSRMDLRYTANAAAITSFTVTYSGSKNTLTAVVCEFSGMAPSGMLDTSVNSGGTTFITSLTSGTYTTTNAKDVLIYVIKTNGSGGPYTAGSGFTIPANASSGAPSFVLQYEIVSATQVSQTTSMTWTNVERAMSVFGAFKAAPIFVARRRVGIF